MKTTVLYVLCALVIGAAATRNVALTPPMGWSSWTSYACGVTADDLTGAATALIEHGAANSEEM